MRLHPISSEDVQKKLANKFSRSKLSNEPPILKITKISQQVKRHDRYSIYINEKYRFSLSEYQLAGSGLSIGKEFTEEELSKFINESAFGKAYERALNYVMIRPRSEREINEYLTRTFLYPKPKMYQDKEGQRHIIKVEVNKEQTKAMIERTVGRLQSKGYINDESFAQSWVNSRQLTKKSSKRKMEQELRSKGVSSDIIATMLQSEDIDEQQNLKDLIVKKQRLSKYKDSIKLTQYLLRQGYNYEDIKNALSGTES